MMKKILHFVLLVFTSAMSYAQLDLSTVFEGGLEDAQVFLKKYLAPAPAGFGYALNGGWYTTAKPNSQFGIDISVISSASFIPNSNAFFTFNNADYTNIKLNDPNLSTAKIPTLLGPFADSGPENNRPLLNFTFNDVTDDISISAPPGLGLEEDLGYNVIPSATIQGGIGIFEHTDLKFRFIPKISENDAELSALGFGIMHDIKHWLPFGDKIPLDVSALVGWTSVTSKVYIDPTNEPTQAILFDTSSLTVQLIASKKVSIFTFYGGFGASSFDSNVSLLGTYKTENNVYKDPINLNFDGSSLRTTLGLRVQLFALTLSADYAFQEYNTFTAGIGFSPK